MTLSDISYYPDCLIIKPVFILLDQWIIQLSKVTIDWGIYSRFYFKFLFWYVEPYTENG
jgi:hypothetical protein